MWCAKNEHSYFGHMVCHIPDGNFNARYGSIVQNVPAQMKSSQSQQLTIKTPKLG